MSLELPADAEPFIPEGKGLSHLSTAGVYALELTRPESLLAAWDAEFDVLPDYFAELSEAETVVYIGASANVLGRLEDHRDGDKRIAALMRVCNIKGLRNIWWFDSAEKAFDREHGIAMQMNNQYDTMYVHSR